MNISGLFYDILLRRKYVEYKTSEIRYSIPGIVSPFLVLSFIFLFSTSGLMGQLTAGDCHQAVPVCTNQNFQISPNGFGAVNELGIGTISNPNTNPASGNQGCLLTGEQNSTWVLVNIAQSGTLMFSFGAPGPVQCFDWIMWRYTPNTCAQILNNTIAPIRCNWNAPCNSFTGMANPIPPGGLPGNFEPPLSVQCGDQFLICFSNYSSAVTAVPLNFFGTALVTCDPIIPLTVSATPPLICQGNSTTLTATGGLNYTWSPATGLSSTTGSTVTASPIATTTYTVTAQNGCGTVSQSVVVTVIPEPVLTVVSTPPTVCQPCNGTASVTVTGGQQPILYSWSPSGGNGPNATGLCPNTYTITVNAGGCFRSQQVILPEPYQILPSLSSTPADCGINNGTATVVNVNGAVAPYTITWNTTPIQSTATLTGLPSGSYAVTIIDANNCRKDTFVFVPLNSSLTLNNTTTPLTCPNSTDATATIFPAQGTPPYSITWNTLPIQNGPTATGLGSGQYIATVSDALNCTLTRVVNIIRPPGTTISSTYNAISCFGGSDGAATAIATQGNPPYTYQWNTTPVQTTSIATGLSIGTYEVLVTDQGGCWERDTVILTQPPAITPTVTHSVLACGNSNNGTATAIMPPNLLNITFTWNTTPAQSTQTATGLSAGTYRIVVENRTGCKDSADVNIAAPPGIQAIFNTTPASCLGASNGSASVIVSGGSPGYTYNWLTTPPQSGNSVNGLPAGALGLVIIDAAGCRDTFYTQIGELPNSLSLVRQIGPVSCVGGSNGSAQVQAITGTGPFQYLWYTTPLQFTSTATNISEGSYRVRVTDAFGCIGFDTAYVTTIPPMQVVIQSTPVSCYGGQNGILQTSVLGGSPPYAYSWNTSPIQNTPAATGLNIGMYTLIVTDAGGCRDTVVASMTQPPRLTITATSTPAQCYQQANGYAIAQAVGGVPGYMYLWSTTPAQTGVNATGLSAGGYTVTVRDLNQCTASAQVQVQQPDDILAGFAFTQPLCYGNQDGSITVNASGGLGPYTYLWSHGASGPTASGLPTGTWSVNITDSRGCSKPASVFLPQPTELIITVSGVDLNCSQPPDNGIGSVFASGGSPPYTYQWNGGLQPTQAWNTGFAAGTWTVIVRDRNLCTRSDSVVLTAPTPPLAHTFPDTFKCAGTGIVPLGGWGSGGSPPYSYLWTPNNGSLSNAFTPGPLANPDSTTTYFLQVVDSAGCVSARVPQKVTVYALPIADAGTDLLFCKDGPAVFLQGSVVQPQGMYDVQWRPSLGLFCDTCLTTYATPDTTTIYTLRVKSRMTGCSSDSTTLNTLSSVLVEVRPRPIAYAGPDTSVCEQDVVSLCGTATGAGPNYQWFWSPSGGLNQHNQQCVSGQPPHSTLFFLVVESNGCLSPADSVLVAVMPKPIVDAGNIQNVCSGDSVLLSGLVQQGIATGYEWVPNAGLNNANLLQPNASPTSTGWYYLRGWNAMCPGDFDSVEVLVHDRPLSIAGPDTSICMGEGIALQGNYTGGNPPVQFQWSPIAGLNAHNTLNPIASPLTSTLYYLEVSSGTGNTLCSSKDSVFITVYPKPEAIIERDTQVICAGQALALTGSGGQGSASYIWSNGFNDIGNGPHIHVQPLHPTTYTLIVREGACSDTTEVPVYVHPGPIADFVISQPDACFNTTVQTQNLSANALSYKWLFGDGNATSNEVNPAYTYQQQGTYTITLIVSGFGGCKDTLRSPIPIQVRPGMDFQVFSDPIAPVELVLPAKAFQWKAEAVHPAEYYWDFGDGGFGTGENINYTYRMPGTYYVNVEAKDHAGCIERKTLGPYVLLAPEVEIPNVFTPNGDGMHDRFMIPYKGDELFTVYVYDRWGTLMYINHNKEQGWDGRDLNGNEAPEGTYFYRVEAGKGAYSGYVVLMR